MKLGEFESNTNRMTFETNAISTTSGIQAPYASKNGKLVTQTNFLKGVVRTPFHPFQTFKIGSSFAPE